MRLWNKVILILILMAILVAQAQATEKERSAHWTDRFSLGGYGEMHTNFVQGGSGDQFDFHRLVVYLGYEFNDWIRFHSEFELEHAFVSSDSDGEISIEQAHVDFLLGDGFNLRAGRILTPVGLVNHRHEPPTFNGVERPSFTRYIIPSTWSSDGFGIFGRMSSTVKYELYVVGGLDGSGFSSTNGIRGGRIKERPSLNDPAVTGRLDIFPLAGSSAGVGQLLRIGLSVYAGGLDNGNKGNDPEIDADIRLFAFDFEYTNGDLEFRGEYATTDIDGAENIGEEIAETIMGYYLEAGYRFMPDSWKSGRLKKSDAVFFVRYDQYDTQNKMQTGIDPNLAGVRDEITIGLTFLPVPSFAIKADYQIRDDDTADGLEDAFNLGLGWQF